MNKALLKRIGFVVAVVMGMKAVKGILPIPESIKQYL